MAATWNVTHFLKNRPEPLTVRFRLSDLRRVDGVLLSAPRVAPLSLEAVMAGNQTEERVWQGLKPATALTVPAGQTHQMWLVTR